MEQCEKLYADTSCSCITLRIRVPQQLGVSAGSASGVAAAGVGPASGAAAAAGPASGIAAAGSFFCLS